MSNYTSSYLRLFLNAVDQGRFPELSHYKVPDTGLEIITLCTEEGGSELLGQKADKTWAFAPNASYILCGYLQDWLTENWVDWTLDPDRLSVFIRQTSERRFDTGTRTEWFMDAAMYAVSLKTGGN